MNLDTTLDALTTALRLEEEAGQVNGLEALSASKLRREMIQRHWQTIQDVLSPIQRHIKGLPSLPPDEQILWAQAVLALPNLAFLEIDTTGLEVEDEIIRFTLIDSHFATLDDFLIQPTTRRLGAEVSRINGITPEALLRDGLAIAEAWKRVQAALTGRYVISFAQDWDLKQLKACAERHNLPPVLVIGEDLQRHCTSYYHREYALQLAALCERIGHPLPQPPQQTSLHRAVGQVHLLTAMAHAITDVQPTKPAADSATSPMSEEEDDDLDESPF
jgi:hypothetical protein